MRPLGFAKQRLAISYFAKPILVLVCALQKRLRKFIVFACTVATILHLKRLRLWLSTWLLAVSAVVGQIFRSLSQLARTEPHSRGGISPWQRRLEVADA